ncbi:histidine ammonia-lyase [Pleionea litopenaei]|uniref:Histidine ammonia-lyase n=1 Tax=Pleionea litopenaei TaxID=3070815 RepID=A0AA51X7X6_9GAMM|nr:histidine ammonia-lyase [Pleionea sp. HL-JVS1]WMS88359.1 histidine ammonia-lyase [Pleionea sp. HL-JVS1]
MQTINVIPGKLTLQELRQIFEGPVQLSLDDSAIDKINQSAATVQQCIDEDRTVYGINTGFGLLAQTRIDTDKLSLLQTSLVLSHAAGLGKPLDEATTRLLMALKINSLAQGHSGIRLSTIELLIELFNHNALPVIPEKGSVGASGDLAPLAHMSAPLIGAGEIILDAQRMPAVDALAQLKMSPIELAPKEGLALLNGTQASTALALKGLFLAENNFKSATIAGAMSVDALLGSVTPFDARIHQVRGHQGQIDSASFYRQLLTGSNINQSHADCEKVQDPYSLRCQPQVMGACLDQLRYAAKTLLIEANAVSDNPLVFSDDQDILSGGNFHAEPVALAADAIAVAIAEIGAISERRIAIYMDKHMSGLPAFLVENSGVNSGFMIAQVTAAALASENKTLAHPASVDSLPTSANQEDHVSMATFAARRLTDMAENTAGVICVELLCAAQGIDFRRPLQSSDVLESAHQKVRQRAAHFDKDRYISTEMEALQLAVLGGVFNDGLPSLF